MFNNGYIRGSFSCWRDRYRYSTHSNDNNAIVGLPHGCPNNFKLVCVRVIRVEGTLFMAQETGGSTCLSACLCCLLLVHVHVLRHLTMHLQ